MVAAVEAEAAAVEAQEVAAGVEGAVEEALEEDLLAGPPQQPVIHADRPVWSALAEIEAPACWAVSHSP